MKKKLLIIVPVILLLVISGSLSIYYFYQTERVDNYLTGEKSSFLLSQVNDQISINTRLEKISNQKKYTFDDPYVELNPYKISPLSAIIIFNTNKEEEISVTINERLVTTMEATKKHVIPIYGLKEDFDNVIKIVSKDNEKIINIKTDKSNIEYPLVVEKKSELLNDEELYFTVASYKTYLTGWDCEGNLRFYLTVDNRMDVEWLDNGHFLIGTSQGQFAENFAAFVEMDYLGKIYNYYVPSNGYSFEFQVLNNGNYMLAGGNKPVYIGEQVIYEVNPADGKTENLINLSSIIKEIDPEFDSQYLGQKAIRNSFYYNEKGDELVVSFRGWDAILSFSFKEKKLNWIFTNLNNELFKNDIWKNYLVKSKNGLYPGGQHSVFITSDGNIGMFNNGYDRLHGFENGGNDLVSYYRDNYSSADIYKINNMSANLVWKYDASKSLFSHQYGSFRELSNGNYLIDFGYNLKDEYRLSDEGSLSQAEANPDNIFSKIIEVDKNKNIIFSATCEEGKYRAFKHDMYSDVTKNLSINSLNIFNTLEEDKTDESSYQEISLDDASEWIYSTQLTFNTFTTNYEINENDNIDLYFVNKTGKIYILNYKDKDNNQKNRIFNIKLPTGEYALYINLNNKIYKTNKVYKV